jgi:drug/metabolite transporter (DMT)-like permease
MNIHIWTSIDLTQYLAFSNLGSEDLVSLIHPILVIVLVFPMVGIVSNFAWQTRQRRLAVKQDKNKIPPMVGKEHVKFGRWLAASVVVVSLIALAYSIVYKSFIQKGLWTKNNPQAVLIILMFVVTIASLILLLRARPKLWRGIFATLTGMGLVIIGQQDGVWRLPDEWYWSHYYLGIAVSLLMIFSLAIIDDIYRSMTIRNLHIALNCLALLLFLGQGITGARDLLEIPPVGKKQPKKAEVEMVVPAQISQSVDRASNLSAS